MTTRILSRDEWPRLAGTLLEDTWPSLPPNAAVMAVEEGGVILGCVALFPAWHLEGVWIAPEQRGRVGVARRLVNAIRTLAGSLGVREVLMMATTDAAARMCLRFGRAIPLTCDHFAVQLKGD
jgi:ribosomal protein S18 acetylase RimI-like enzyme